MPRKSNSPTNAQGTAAPSRRWGFRIAALLAPFLLLIAGEVFLRFKGSYRPTDYWIPTAIDGETMPNPDFASRFVGRSMARMPRSIRVNVNANQPKLRILVFGESAALGDPEPAFGFSRFLQALLEARLPERKVEVINTAITALNSYALRDAAEDSRQLHADFWVVYAGNNEVIGPFGPAAVPGGQPPNLKLLRAGLALRKTALGQWLTERQALASDGLSLTQRWVGLEQFLDRPIPETHPGLPTTRNHFGRNLKDLVSLGVDSGARVLLGTMAVNLVDSAPFGSVPPKSTNDPSYSQWTAVVQKGIAADDAGELVAAIAAWTNAVALRPDDAESRYRLGLARLNNGEASAGRADLERARDLDTLRFRADTGMNQVVRDVAGSFSPLSNRVILVDSDRSLVGDDPVRPPGSDLFYEHVHLRPEGNYRLALLFAQPLVQALGNPPGPTNWLSYSACLDRLGWSPQAEARIWNQVRALTQRPPFSHQSNAELRNRYLDDRIADATTAARKLGLSTSIARVRAAVEKHPEDWPVREQLARLYQSGRQWSNAAVEWRAVVKLAPTYVVGWYQLGETLAQAGARTEAQQAYREALHIRPDFVDAYLGLGVALGEAGDLRGALESIDIALKNVPDHQQARINRGVALIGLNRFDEGVAEFRRAAQQHTNSIAPLVRLAEAYSSKKQYAQAAEAYTEAVKRDPSNAALSHRLAIEFSRAHLLKESEAAFRHALRLDPNFVTARVDLGVALAQQARFPEAVSEFEAALLIQPTNALAQSYLEKARAQLAQPGKR